VEPLKKREAARNAARNFMICVCAQFSELFNFVRFFQKELQGTKRILFHSGPVTLCVFYSHTKIERIM